MYRTVSLLYSQEHILEIERQKVLSQLDAPGRLLELSYESLCDDPEAAFIQIATFFAVSPERFDRSQLKSVKNMNYKYQESLESSTINKLNQILSPVLQQYGYSV